MRGLLRMYNMRTYQYMQQKIIKLNICGDGRCDIPGECTKYGTYTVKVENSSEILDFEVIHVAQVTSSNATEAELGCNRVL